MKIALVSDWFLPRLGGIELQVRDLAVQLRRRGHRPEIITPVEGPPDLDGIPVHRLGVPRLPGAGVVYTPLAFRRIREVLAAGRYDVVHVHYGIIAPVAHGATFISQELGLPTVATVHSVLTHFGIPLRLIRRAMGVGGWRVQWSAVSHVVAHSMRPLVGDAPVAVVPNGIDISYWARPSAARSVPDARDPSVGALRAVSVMRLHRRKRPAILLDAVRHAGGRVRLELVGDGPEMRAVKRRIRRMGLGDVVSLRGWLPRHDVRQALWDADVFLMPSRLEAFGVAALEARCAGVPVIAMESSGAREFLEHGIDSLLARNDEEFVSSVRRVAGDPALLRQLARGAALPPASAGWDAVIPSQERLYAAAAGSSDLGTPGDRALPSPHVSPDLVLADSVEDVSP